MFGHGELGTYAFSEFPALRLVYAVVAKIAVLPRFLGRSKVDARYGVAVKSAPK